MKEQCQQNSISFVTSTKTTLPAYTPNPSLSVTQSTDYAKSSGIKTAVLELISFL